MLHFGIRGFRRIKSGHREIKFSHTLLDDRRFRELSEREKGILWCLTLAAARYNNRLPGDIVKLSALACLSTPLKDQDLLSLGQLELIEWIADDQEALAAPKRLHISDDLKAEIIARQGGRCHHCRRALDTKTEFDHVEPVSKGGETTSDNLVAAHQRCNRHKAARARRIL